MYIESFYRLCIFKLASYREDESMADEWAKLANSIITKCRGFRYGSTLRRQGKSQMMDVKRNELDLLQLQQLSCEHCFLIIFKSQCL